MLEYRYDTQLLIDGHDLDEDVIYDYFVDNFKEQIFRPSKFRKRLRKLG